MTAPNTITTWDEYVGQEGLKRRLKVSIMAAKNRDERLPHVLFATGQPGAGKTTAAKIVANEMGVKMVTVTPPLKVMDIMNACETLNDGDILFIDEIHKLADSGKRGTEVLLTVLESHTITFEGEEIILPDVTIIGATTDLDKLPETILDRFKIKPSFERYSLGHMIEITNRFLGRYKVNFSNELVETIATASRFTPRVIEEFVLAARDLQDALGEEPPVDELLDFQQVTKDGLTAIHTSYLKFLLKQGRQTYKREWVYEAGETLMVNALRETRQGIQRAERYLMELGYVERTASGRRLTDAGVRRATELAAAHQ